jgi:predicted TPR repeat methyltransferase
MRSEWDEPGLVEPWARAMGEEGDHWREALINPVVVALAEAIARREDPFALSFFAPLVRAVRQAPPAPVALDALSVVDFGCGEGCLGRVLARRGATLLGLDSSDGLLAIARQRAASVGEGQLIFARADLEASDGFRAVEKETAAIGAPSLTTAVVVLDHMAEVGPFLGWVASWLAAQEGEVPFLCVTLAPERLEPGVVPSGRPGESMARRRAVVESCQREVTLWLRSRRLYERSFRDAGLFVRRCEPLYFHPRHGGVPAEEREDASRRPVFWAWLLSARRRVVPAPASVRWPADSHAAALQASVQALGAEAEAPCIYDFRPRDVIIRVHNMGGELFALLSGSAVMMDAQQELMTFRAGEVMGDLETPDGSGQCGSFPFDVAAGEGGCRVAVFSEATASAVLAHSRDIGSRLFRLLRDRLRLALWHYDIREMVGEYLEIGSERLEKRLLHRCARAILWASTIESRGRAIGFGQEVAFLDPETIARRFKPGTERIDFGLVIRQLHLLRMIDAFPGAALRKEEEARAAASWEALLASVTRVFLLSGIEMRHEAAVRANAGRLRVSGQLVKDGSRTRQFQEVVDDLTRLPVSGSDWPARIERWAGYVARAHRCWEDRNPWLIVLRDVPGLRRLAVGTAQTMDDTLAARADYLLGEGRRPTWELVTAQASPARRLEYISLLDALVAADLAAVGRLAFSSEAAGATGV